MNKTENERTREETQVTASTAATEEYIYYLLTILKHNGKGALINKHAFIIMLNYGANNNSVV